MRRHRRGMEPLTDINVTNLLDTAFVLLMAFMIVAPSMNAGFKIDLPTVKGGTIDSQKTVNITIQKRPDPSLTEPIYLDDRRVTLEQLADQVRQSKESHPKLDVIMAVDKEVSYDSFAQVMGTIKNLGIDSIGLLTEQPPDIKQP